MSIIKKNGKKRWSPSYLRNRGHMSKGQRRILRERWPQYGLTIQYDQKITFPTSWNRQSPLVLEIGFGQGENLLCRASREPNTLFLGVEVHKPAIANIIKKIQTDNIRIIRCDALALLHDHMPKDSLWEVCIFFPEPWSEHNKHRRIMNTQTLSAIEPLVKKGAHLFFATDIKEYAHDVHTILHQSPNWSSQYDYLAPRPNWRMMSKYEKKGIDEGRSIFDLHWTY
ncbi:MAG: tRNA (guanosine(46)-N7)-methyltransferase TrmB, partial [Deltaproteobacteria bacterium]|nr:tRNA (guanosine(46)-N7)-methyltransferase TrmB [Deltaproteobacteria bacterium]